MGCCLSKTNVDLDAINFDKVESFGFKNMTFDAKVLNVYDGDTITIGFLWNNIAVKMRMRFYGIDTPEIKHASTLHSNCGKYVRDYLENIINHKNVIIKTHKTETDKFGRLLGDVIFDGVSISQLLLSKGYAKETAKGGHKFGFTDAELHNLVL